MRPNRNVHRIGPAPEPAHPTVAVAPVSRAYQGLAGSFLAVVERAQPTLTTHPIGYDAAALFDGGTINLPPLDKKVLRKIALAVNTAEWREKHNTPEHKKARAAHVQQKRAGERAEAERVEEIEGIHKTRNVVPPFVMTDAPHGKGLLVTGGYDNDKIEEIEHAQENSKGRVTGKGHGSLDDATDLEVEWDDQFVENKFRRLKRGKKVRRLHELIRQSTFVRETKSTDPREKRIHRVLCCLHCKVEISLSPEQDLELSYRHMWEHHRDVFNSWMTKLDGAGCLEDHEGMKNRHAGGHRSVYCAHCRKLIWKAPRLYTHTPSDTKTGARE